MTDPALPENFDGLPDEVRLPDGWDEGVRGFQPKDDLDAEPPDIDDYGSPASGQR
ncbi:hypothetical protein [Glycomyces sp. NPDC048151]|uniref:hypothetical protein n=1 Tax=Glycomyces sp. NPDC048151 TaxID=3364002 RepID=UPI00371EEEF9